jgi:hypothetical protein
MSVIKKVTIPVKDLPSMTIDNKYLVRYRVVSDDRNRISQWSPLYTITVPYITKTISNISATGTKVTYTTLTPHNFIVGDIVTISDTSPTKYSYISIAITDVVSTTQFSVASTDTGSYVDNAGLARVNLGGEILKSLSVSGKTANLTWTLPNTITNKSFDVYARTQTGSPAVWGDYVFQGTVTSNTFSMIATAAASKIQFLVQVSTDTKMPSPGAILFHSAESNI